MHQLLTSVLVPRPIAWIATADRRGDHNLAPFSFFGGVSTAPPLVAISIGWRDGGSKHTAQNLRSRPEGVIHIVDAAPLAAMHQTSADYPAGVDEAAQVGLAWEPSAVVLVNSLVGTPVRLEVRVVREVPLPAFSTDLFLLEVVCFHVRKGLFDGTQLTLQGLDVIGRLGGGRYAHLEPTQPYPTPEVPIPVTGNPEQR